METGNVDYFLLFSQHSKKRKKKGGDAENYIKKISFKNYIFRVFGRMMEKSAISGRYGY